MSATVRFKDESGIVLATVKKASFKNLEKAAAWIYRVARNSIRETKFSASAPGKPPHTRPQGKTIEGDRVPGILKRAFAFSVDKMGEVAVIGPTRSAIGGIAHTHEFGGTEPPKGKTLRRSRYDFKIGSIGPIRVSGTKLVLIHYTTAKEVQKGRELMSDPNSPRDYRFPPAGKARRYPARPFMGPALLKAKDRIPAFWANSIKGG